MPDHKFQLYIIIYIKYFEFESHSKREVRLIGMSNTIPEMVLRLPLSLLKKSKKMIGKHQ